MKNKPIKWGFKFWFRCGAKSGYLYEFDMYLGKKGNTEFGLGESVILSLCQKLKDTHCFVFFDNFFTSPALLVKLLERRVKGSKDTVKVKCPSVIQEYNQFMGGVNISNQMKVTYEVDHWSKFRFYLRVFFDFLDIVVVNSKIVIIKLNQHLHYLHSTFNTVLHKL